MITSIVLEQFKARMRITHNSEDSNLQELLSFSVAYITAKCGAFDFENEQAKELVFERTRFAYNDALEYFEDSFRSEIHSLGIEMALKAVVPNAPTI
ncbi:head-tail connector protein [Sporosarcina sp. A2]|uniref:head-tail connector protein n=1 Tax=Sporosarcina sp. A2 TaxID=3393449 RepID=UPI003D7B9DC9